ncbi:hypothetical protein Vadar_026749 [Vaccinium darrowii]|uniref:Uncharacterized protein n=1 Tax=Vaccinium darrowii TaxID=229202 RepID=A0ACB7XCJ6_9ERIC|nr:hypothetical protein Vadar_026749 [Vaccinium darrowii]
MMIGSIAPTSTYNECRGCQYKCRAEQVPMERNDPINSAYHYRCVCHRKEEKKKERKKRRRREKEKKRGEKEEVSAATTSGDLHRHVRPPSPPPHFTSAIFDSKLMYRLKLRMERVTDT